MPFVIGVLAIPAGSLLAEDGSASFQNPAPPAPSEERPGYIYFNKGTFTRLSKNKIAADIELAGKLPSNFPDKRIVYQFNFDIDNNRATGTESIAFPGFGMDIWAWAMKEQGTNRFEDGSTEAVFQGRTSNIRITKLKVDDNKITCELSSELFGEFPVLRVYMTSHLMETDRNNKVLSKAVVDQLPRRGALTLNSK